MLDLKQVTDHPDEIQNRMSGRKNTAGLEHVVELGSKRRALIVEVEQLRHELKKANAEMKTMIREDPSAADRLRSELKASSLKQKQLESDLKEIEQQLHDLLLEIPNLPHESVPRGNDEADNQIVKTTGEPKSMSFEPRPHWEIGERLGILDFARGAKLSGSRFTVLHATAAKLERALANFMLDLHTREHGYIEVTTPYMVLRETMQGTGQLPKFEEDAFKTTDPEMFLIPTAEVPVTNLHRNEIIDLEALPINYAAHTPCFRREAGAHGKDTRGLMRQHQFNKVELVTLCSPEQSYERLEVLTRHAEEVLIRLDLPYRVMSLCTGDLGFSAAKTYDLEAWMPGLDGYREISSCSNCEDFQARRARIRLRRAKGEKPELLHTLNGSGLAIGRTMAAILENHQQADGSVRIPEALVPYTGFDLIRP